MPPANPDIAAANDQIRAGVLEQINDLAPSAVTKVGVDAILTELKNLASLLGGNPNDPPNELLAEIIDEVEKIQDGSADNAAFGPLLGNLDTLKHLIENNATTETQDILASVIARTAQLLNYRPDVTAILGDLEAVKSLKGGPADATAFHDFHVLQIAFKNVWVQVADANLKDKAAQLYDETVRLYSDAGLTAPDFASVNDVKDLRRFLDEVQRATGITPSRPSGVTIYPPAVGRNGEPTAPPPVQGSSTRSPVALPMPSDVGMAFPEVALFWNELTAAQQAIVLSKAAIINDENATRQDKDQARKDIATILRAPESAAGRVARLILEIGDAISEPYAFDVFAPDSYNYGIMLTYRQRWEPGTYQAGDLAATICLAPGESRKYSKRKIVKTARSQKEIEKSMSSRSTQSSDVSRGESEIMQKASTATNFKMTTDGSFNIGIGNINSSTVFALNQGQESASNKKEFHEATLKAAEEYRLERALEVDTSSSVETEESSSGEISNPNNEITVTYLFYELQRRYKISEFIYRARPVILVAQDVPAPHQIDEAWLLQYQWILSRVLLDDSFRPALNYLSSGMAGDEISLAVVRSQWEAQTTLTKKLESQTQTLLDVRDALRDLISRDATQKALNEAQSSADAANFFLNPFASNPLQTAQQYVATSQQSDILEINRKAAETRLKYVEDSLADAQSKLKQATDAFQKATQAYATALQQQYSRHVAIDQLRLHVKQNILYYMQAIWAHEVPDQRFFRLYNKKVACSKPDPNQPAAPKVVRQTTLTGGPLFQTKLAGGDKLIMKLALSPAVPSGEVDLVEMADLDNPLGFKGNYIIFPLKQHCYLTDYMLNEFIDSDFGIRDPDPYGSLSIEQLGEKVREIINSDDSTEQDKTAIKELFLKYLTAPRRTTDEIIVPTGQLFIEALPGSHPLLEDFKLLHRVEDVRKVKAEVRHNELENLRLAARLVAGEREDPEIKERILIDKGIGAVINPGP
jgi:hypothetical protein